VCQGSGRRGLGRRERGDESLKAMLNETLGVSLVGFLLFFVIFAVRGIDELGGGLKQFTLRGGDDWNEIESAVWSIFAEDIALLQTPSH
jgi:hypothetical protein